jgi:glycosyltransferase involved in cell wall biosynthesis
MPKVSVIIPNYNHSEYLHQRINSVLGQSYQDFELILLDDQSSDDSQEILNSYRNHPKVSKIIFNDVNSGNTFKQWEKGINSAKGHLIWIAESDDWCELSLLDELVSAFDKDPDCVISYCQSHCVLDSNVISWTSHHTLLSETVHGKEFVNRYMATKNTIFNASMVLWKKQIYSKISHDFLSYRFCGDWLFWVELAQFGNVHISGKTLNYFRKHPKDVSGKAEKTGLSLFENMKLLNTLFQQQLIDSASYNVAYKLNFMKYWQQHGNIPQQYQTQISYLYENPLSGKKQYYKSLLSAFNRYNLKLKRK